MMTKFTQRIVIFISVILLISLSISILLDLSIEITIGDGILLTPRMTGRSSQSRKRDSHFPTTRPYLEADEQTTQLNGDRSADSGIDDLQELPKSEREGETNGISVEDSNLATEQDKQEFVSTAKQDKRNFKEESKSAERPLPEHTKHMHESIVSDTKPSPNEVVNQLHTKGDDKLAVSTTLPVVTKTKEEHFDKVTTSKAIENVHHNPITPTVIRMASLPSSKASTRKLKVTSLRLPTAPKPTTGQHQKAVVATLRRKRKKTILIYTTLFGKDKWVDLNDKQIVDYPQRAGCPHANTCKLTYNKKAIDHAEAVLFHAVDLVIMKKYNVDHLLEINKRRPAYQRWIFLSQESPHYYNKFQNHTNLFNWTMSYESRSDIFYPYNHFRHLSAEEKKAVTSRDYSEGKEKLVIWTVSHCGLLREEYAKALQKYINITLVGNCASKMGSKATPCKRDTKECTKMIKKHKFTLAFENSFCRDYITEKFFSALQRFDLVPIVFGANYNSQLVPSGSYIDTANFPSIKALADYLLYLDKNHTAYNEYFAWKKKYKIWNFDKICLLCQKVHEPNLPAKIYKDVWSVDRSCKEYEPKLEKYTKMIQKANLTSR